MDQIKLFRCLIHVKGKIRSSNCISANVMEDSLENDVNDILVKKIYIKTLQDKRTICAALLVKINIICICFETG